MDQTRSDANNTSVNSIKGMSGYCTKSTNKTPYIMTIIALAILLLVGVGLGAAGFVLSLQAQDEIDDLKAENAVLEQPIKVVDIKNDAGEVTQVILPNSDYRKADEAVRGMIAEIGDLAGQELGESGTSMSRIYVDDGTVTTFYRPNGTEVLLPLDKAYGLEISEVSDVNKIIDGGWNNSVIGFLKGKGFEQMTTTEALPYEMFYSKDSGIVCSVGAAELPWKVHCSHRSWTNTEVVDLTLEVFDESNYGEVNVLVANPKDIQETKDTDYQTLKANVPGGYALFYRNGENGNWRFVTAGNGLPACDKFDDEAKQAFVGTTCSNGGTAVEIKP